MTAYGAFDFEGDRDAAEGGPSDPVAVLTAVREDIRQTLRMAWVDPALEAAASSAPFFTAAWSAIRPNVGKSFLLLSKAMRNEAVESARTRLDPPSLRELLEHTLSNEELRRIEDTSRAAHVAAAKIHIVVHALYRAARRERVAGTGREESPVRRGIPEWQRWMSFQPAPERAKPILEECSRVLGSPVPPMALRLLARWPAALASLWEALGPQVTGEGWRAGTGRLRRMVLAGISTLPHPVELQWTALRARGFTEQERSRLVDLLASYDAAMASQTLSAAFAWTAFGAPEIGPEG